MPLIDAKNSPKSKSESKVAAVPLRKRSIKTKRDDFSPKSILNNYRKFFSDDNIITNAKQGVEMSAITDFSILSGRSQKEIAELIHTTAKTLQNYAAGKKRLPVLQSELLLKLYALYDKGLGTFDGVHSFNAWLAAPAFGLYNDIPETLLTTSTGINEVMDELIRIEYGDLA